MQIHYEPHPVSAARKAELRALGFKVLDARFAPADTTEIAPTEAVAEPIKRRGRPRKAAD